LQAAHCDPVCRSLNWYNSKHVGKTAGHAPLRDPPPLSRVSVSLSEAELRGANALHGPTRLRAGLEVYAVAHEHCQRPPGKAWSVSLGAGLGENAEDRVPVLAGRGR